MHYYLFFQGVPWAGTIWLEKGVFYLLLVLSLIVLINIAIKQYRFSRIKKESRKYAPMVAKHLKNLNLKEAVELSKDFSERSHLAKIVFVGLEEYKETKELFSTEKALKMSKNKMDAVSEHLKYEYAIGIGFLDSVGRTSPFLGALGGSATTFAIGILVAIPAVWFASYERNKSGMLAVEVKNASHELVEYLEKKNA